jgi:hypothetical protein
MIKLILLSNFEMGADCEVKGLPGRPRRGWGDIIRMELKGGVDWLHLVRDEDQSRASVNTVMKLQVP